MTTPRFSVLTIWRLFALLSGLLFCVAAQAAEIGRITFAAGGVTVTNAAGVTRNATKGEVLAVGDTVSTTAGGRAQLLFSDGADVALQPDTAYRIEDYRYNGKPDGQEVGAFRLIKGALRTITGAIGRENRNAYRISTTTATIGIRGTEYTARFDTALRVSVFQGLILMFNRGGEQLVGPGQTGIATSQDLRPLLTVQNVGMRPPGVPLAYAFVTSEQRNTEGQSIVLGGEHHSSGDGSGSGTMFAAAMGDVTNTGASAGAYFPGAAITDYNLVASGSNLSEFRYFNFQGVLGTASIAESGTAFGISYGVWTMPGATASDFSNTYVNPNVAYVFANKNAVALPTSGTVTLSPVASTSPVNAAGMTGTFLGATLGINFGATSDAVTLSNLQASVNGATYTVNSLTSSGFFSGSDGRFSVFTANTTCTGGSCGTGGLGAKASGLLINGGAAGLAYTIADPNGSNKSVVGAVVFTGGSF